MMRKEETLKGIKILLLCFICTLSYILWSEINRPINIQINKDEFENSATQDNVSVIDIETNEQLIADYDEIVERPLFFEDRKPYVYIEPEKTKPTSKNKKTKPIKEKQYLLNAVMITADKKIALIQSGQDKSTQRLAIGESIDNWIIEKIEARSVLLKKGDTTKSLELEIKTSKTRPKSTTNKKTKKEMLKKVETKEIAPKT